MNLFIFSKYKANKNNRNQAEIKCTESRLFKIRENMIKFSDSYPSYAMLEPYKKENMFLILNISLCIFYCLFYFSLNYIIRMAVSFINLKITTYRGYILKFFFSFLDKLVVLIVTKLP